MALLLCDVMVTSNGSEGCWMRVETLHTSPAWLANLPVFNRIGAKGVPSSLLPLGTSTQLPHSFPLEQGSLIFQNAQCFAQASDLGRMPGFPSCICLCFVDALLLKLGQSLLCGLQLGLHSTAV